MSRLRSLVLTLLLLVAGIGGQAFAATKSLQLNASAVKLSAAKQPNEESVFTLAPFGWFFSGGYAPGVGSTVIQAYDQYGQARQTLTFPAGNVVHALHVLDDGAVWGLCRKGDSPTWRLTKLSFFGELLADVPLVFPDGFELPVPEAGAQFHFCPSQKATEVRGLYFKGGPDPVMKTFVISTYGVVTSTRSDGFRDREGHSSDLVPGPDHEDKPDQVELKWQGDAKVIETPHFTLDIWEDQLLLQTSQDGLEGEVFLLADKKLRPLWSEPLIFPLRNNGYSFFHYDTISRTVTIYPYLDAMMGTGWRPFSPKRHVPKVPRRN